MEAAEDLVDDAALRVLQAPAGQLLGDRVEIFDAALRVGRDDAVADRLQRDLRALLLLEQRLLEQLALGHVEVDADDAMSTALLVDARFRATHDPQPHAIAMAQPMHALEQRLVAGEMIAQRRAHALEIVRMNQLLPVGQRLDLIVAVAEHGLPARREIRGLAIEVEVPQAVVRAVQRERVALLDLLQVPLIAHALDTGGITGAEQLQHEVQVRVPAVARQSRAQRDEAGRLALRREADDERGADAQRRQLRRFRREIAARLRRVADLDDAQVLQPIAQVREPLERLAAQRLGIESREQAGRADDVLDDRVRGIERRDQQRVEARSLAQRFEVLAHQRVGVLVGEILEIDRGLGEQDIQPRLRSRAGRHATETAPRRCATRLSPRVCWVGFG